MADNQGSAGSGAGNPDPNAGNPNPADQGAGNQGSGNQPPAFSWKTQLPADFAGSPTMQKFPDTKEGLSEAIKSHLSLEKMLGHEKVPIPKNKEDVEGWAIFSKALGIPDKPDGYGLEDAKIPENLKGVAFDKVKFAEFALKHKMTPDQAKGAWSDYTELTKSIYAKAVNDQKDKVTVAINQLRGEWGDAYNAKVELGQLVINKFAPNKEANDYLNAVLVSDPVGIKFLAQIGEQFSENKIGDFKYARHALSGEEAAKEVAEIRKDPNHPYNNDKATPAERDAAIDHVNDLLSVINKTKSKG